MDENDSLSEYNKITLGHNRTNGSVYSKIYFKVENLLSLLCSLNIRYLLLVTSGCLAVVYSAWSAIAALHLSVIVFSLDLELRLLHSFGTIGESSIEHR